MKAKALEIKPISSKDANRLIRLLHYSGKVVRNSQLHFGVFYQGKCGGALSLGPSMDKQKLIGLVEGTQWNDFIELNRMAFADWLPRNSESRALGVTFRLLRKHYPHLKWVVTFADATQCGDGTIYRAVGAILTGIQKNNQLYRLPFPEEIDANQLKAAGATKADIAILCQWLKEQMGFAHRVTLQCAGGLSVEGHPHSHVLSVEGHPHSNVLSVQGGTRPNKTLSQVKIIMRKLTNGRTSANTLFRLMGGAPAEGYQLRYIYFLDKAWESKLTVPIIPYSKIDEMDIGMYKGKKKDASKVLSGGTPHTNGEAAVQIRP